MANCRISGLLLCLSALQASPGRTQLYPSQVPLNIVSIAGDRHGLIWTAAAEGVFRFDGLHYQAIPGYPFKSAQFIAVEPGGAVWAGGPQGLARYENSGWKVVLTEAVEGMAMGPVGLWANAGELRLISYGKQESRFADAKPTGELLVDGEGALWFPCGENVCTMRPPDWRLESRKNPAPGNWRKVTPEKGGRRYWLSSRDEVALVEDGAVRAKKKAPFAGEVGGFRPPLDPDLSPGGSVWGTRLHLQPMDSLQFWQSGFGSFFADESTKWFSEGNKVGKSIRGTDWDSWTFSYLSGEGFLLRHGKTPILFTDRGVLVQNDDRRGWQRGPAAPILDVMIMIEDGLGGYWLTSRDAGLVRTGRDFEIIERFPNLCTSADWMRGLLRDGKGRTWAGGKDPNCFFEVQGGPGTWKFVPQQLPEGTLNAVEMHTDVEGRPWVGYHYGIAYLDDAGEWRRIATSEPVTLVRTFEFDGKDTIWVAHRQPGFFTRLERNGGVWQVRRFSGELAWKGQTEFLRRDSRGWIWRGTLTDVQVARPGRYEPGDWLRLTPSNGMASEGVSLRGWTEDDQGNVWLAGNGGVTRMRPSAEWFDAPKARRPLVTHVSVGGKSWFDPDRMPSQFPKVSGPMEIDLSGIDANPFQQSAFRYRLLEAGPEWKPTVDGRLRFDGLAGGSYTLEAAYTGEGAPDVLRWQFQVGNPSMRYLIPALSLGALGVLAPWGWRRREWLRYWSKKQIFLLGRLVFVPSRDRECAFNSCAEGAISGEVVWTNYVGKTLAKRYEVLDRISRGETSVTYLSRDRETGEKAVVKVFHRTPGQERGMRNRFAQEVAALHTLSQPDIVRVLNSWISPDGEPCLAMPYLDGPTLRELLNKEGIFDSARAGRILEQLGSEVASIHERGIVHRDLKPENVIVLYAGSLMEQIVVIDFGSSAMRGPEKDLEHTITLTGSMHYLAPERLAGHYSPASDVYSLGVMALEMVSGKRPAEMEVAPAGPEFVMAVSAWTDVAAAEKIAAALQHQPSHRPPDVWVWAKELAALLRHFSGNHPDGPPSI